MKDGRPYRSVQHYFDGRPGGEVAVLTSLLLPRWGVEASRTRHWMREEECVVDSHFVSVYVGERPSRWTVWADGVRAPVREGWQTDGDVVFVPAGCPHRLVHDGLGTDDVYISLPPDFLPTVAGEERAVSAPRFGVRDPRIEHVARALLAEMSDEAPGGSLYAESLVMALAAHLTRGRREALNDSRKRAQGLSPADLRRALDYIHDALPVGDLSVADIAAQVCLSPCHFARLFRQSTGVAPHQYVTRQRVERARALLHTGDVSVTEAAHAVGFASGSQLAVHTRRLLGVSPRQLRDG